MDSTIQFWSKVLGQMMGFTSDLCMGSKDKSAAALS